MRKAKKDSGVRRRKRMEDRKRGDWEDGRLFPNINSKHKVQNAELKTY